MSEKRDLEFFETDWLSLRPHFEREALFVVEPQVLLKDAAEALVADDRLRVEEWLKNNQLRKPTAEEDREWSASRNQKFRFVIVQPFVLVQNLPLNSH
jgi:hypothetical protein